MKSGFTLIELILVVALISIITGFSAVFYSRFLTQNAVLNTVDQLVGQMRKAQIYAISGRQNTGWGVKYANSQITLYAVGNSAFDEIFNVNSNITVSGLSNIDFYRITGTPSATPTITVNNKTITINSLGMINR